MCTGLSARCFSLMQVLLSAVCPVGSYCTGGTVKPVTCASCSIGKYVSAACTSSGASSSAPCTACPLGCATCAASYSLFVNGGSQYASVPSAVYFSTASFTVESWVMLLQTGLIAPRIFDFGTSSVTSDNIGFVYS